MGLSSYSGGGGGRDFLPGDEITEGQTCVLLEQPTMEQKDFGNGPETAPSFVMEVPDLRGYQREGGEPNEKGVFEWTPGKFAVGFLMQHLGTNEADWNYPIEGHFERRTVQTKYGKKKALHFIPDGITEEAGAPKQVSNPRAGAKTTLKGSGTTGGTGGKNTNRTTEFKCKRHPAISFDSKDDYLAHLESH